MIYRKFLGRSGECRLWSAHHILSLLLFCPQGEGSFHSFTAPAWSLSHRRQSCTNHFNTFICPPKWAFFLLLPSSWFIPYFLLQRKCFPLLFLSQSRSTHNSTLKSRYVAVSWNNVNIICRQIVSKILKLLDERNFSLWLQLSQDCRPGAPISIGYFHYLQRATTI